MAHQLKWLSQMTCPKRGKKLSSTNLTHHYIEVKDSNPIRQNPRRTSPAVLADMQKLVDQYLREDIIKPCKSPWCSPPVFAKKSNGSYRLCIDSRKLNLITKKHDHLLPNPDSLLDKFRNAKIDMTSAFLEVDVDLEPRDYTAFSDPGRSSSDSRGCRLDWPTVQARTKK